MAASSFTTLPESYPAVHASYPSNSVGAQMCRGYQRS